MVSISGNGQVSASNEVDVQAKTSGEITGVYGKAGQAVKTGTVLAYIEASDAQSAVEDAKLSLETAQLSLDRIVHPDNVASVLQVGNSLAAARDSRDAAYENAFTDISDVFLDLPGIISGLDDIFTDENSSPYMSDASIRFYANTQALDRRNEVAKQFYDARDQYEEAHDFYKTTGRTTSTEVIVDLLSQTQAAAQGISDLVRETNTLVEYLENHGADKTQVAVDVASLAEYARTLSGDISSLRSASDSIISSERNLAEKQQDSEDTNEGPDELDLRSAQITVEQRQNALRKAQLELAKYTVRAPFDGVIATIDAQVGDDASASTAIVTLITKQKIAVIPLNEVDVVKVQEGQKATLTFDALPDITITGKVVQVAGVGVTTQGVVNYNVEIAFDAGDDRIKPGMSASAAIITDAKQDALLVPNSAVKTQGGASYVQVVNSSSSESAPENVEVEVGISNDSMTEILSGLSDGETVVTQTITGSASASTQANGVSGLSILGGRAGGFGGATAPRTTGGTPR